MSSNNLVYFGAFILVFILLSLYLAFTCDNNFCNELREFYSGILNWILEWIIILGVFLVLIILLNWWFNRDGR